MTEPQPVMAQPEQDQLTRQVGRALLTVAGDGWQRVRAEYRSTGRHIEVDVFVTGTDGAERPVRPPQEVVEGLGRLRQGMYRPGRGTWFSALYVLEPPSAFSAEFEPDVEPRWRRVPPPIGFADELKFFPRADENIPDWLRQRAGLPPLEPPAGEPSAPGAPAGTPAPQQGAGQTPPPGIPPNPFTGSAPQGGGQAPPGFGAPQGNQFAAPQSGQGEPTPPPGFNAPQGGQFGGQPGQNFGGPQGSSAPEPTPPRGFNAFQGDPAPTPPPGFRAPQGDAGSQFSAPQGGQSEPGFNAPQGGQFGAQPGQDFGSQQRDPAPTPPPGFRDFGGQQGEPAPTPPPGFRAPQGGQREPTPPPGFNAPQGGQFGGQQGQNFGGAQGNSAPEPTPPPGFRAPQDGQSEPIPGFNPPQGGQFGGHAGQGAPQGTPTPPPGFNPPQGGGQPSQDVGAQLPQPTDRPTFGVTADNDGAPAWFGTPAPEPTPYAAQPPRQD